MNNTIHYQWFDTAVNGWLIDTGLLDLGGSGSAGAGDPIGLVVETGCRYAGSISYPDAVEVGLAVAETGRSSVRYRIGIFPAGHAQAAAEGFFVHVLVGRDDRRPVAMPDRWRAAFDAIRREDAGARS